MSLSNELEKDPAYIRAKLAELKAESQIWRARLHDAICATEKWERRSETAYDDDYAKRAMLVLCELSGITEKEFSASNRNADLVRIRRVYAILCDEKNIAWKITSTYTNLRHCSMLYLVRTGKYLIYQDNKMMDLYNKAKEILSNEKDTH